MKKLFTMMATALLVLGGTRTAYAEMQTNYAEPFDNIDVSAHDFAPKGWGHIVESAELGWGNEYYVTYTNPTEGGQNGAYLAAGEQTFSDWYSGDEATVNDLLVTPAVTGNVSFYAKLTKSSGSVKLYTCTKEGNSYKMGNEYAAELPSLSDTQWTLVSLPNVAAGTHIGIRLENAGIDEFTAASADIELKKSLSVDKVTLMGENELLANESNEVSFTFEVQVTNNGDMELTPGMENYSISIINYSRGNEVVATQAINETLAIGASATVTVTATVPVVVDEGDDEMYERFDICENFNATSKMGSWITAIPYVSILKVYGPKSSYMAMEEGEVLDFGIVSDNPSSIELQLANAGAKPLRITSIDRAEGIECTPALPIELLPGGEKLTLTLTLGNSVPGEKNGSIVFKEDDNALFSLASAGLVIENGIYYENFEKEEYPIGMIIGENWDLSSSHSNLQTATNKQWMDHSLSNFSKLILPKLAFEAGDVLSFRGAKKYDSGGADLNIYYSTDRKEWTLLKSFTEADFSDEKVSYDASYDGFLFTWLNVDNIPAGEGYIAFEAGLVRIDDVYGGKLVAVAHDLFLSAYELPSQATVNNRYTATLSAQNINSTVEKAGSYTVTLYVNGEAVATADNTADWAAGETKTFELAFTPHVAGTMEAYMEITADDNYTVSTEKANITVGKEMFMKTITVGTATGTGDQSPLNTFYKNSVSETIYPAEKLGGLQAGEQITGLIYKGYNMSKVLPVHLRVWMECTADAAFGDEFTPRDTNEMTLVYDSDYNFEMVGTSTNIVEVLRLAFTEPFEYTGGNVRIVMEHTSTVYTRIYFEQEAEMQNTTICRKSDSDISSATWEKASQGMPVVTFMLEAEAPTVSGTVTDKTTGNPIEGATVELTTGDILYSGVTDETGHYSIEIFVEWRDFDVTIRKEGYKTLTQSRAISFEDTSIEGKNFELEQDLPTALAQTQADDMLCYTTPQGVKVVCSRAMTLHLYDVTGRLIRRIEAAEGETYLERLTAGVYILNGQRIMVK